jgi:hypothetical protein
MLSLGCQSELCNVTVRLNVLDAVALQRGLVGHGLGHMTFTGAGLANDKDVGPFRDEFEGVQFKASLPGYLGVKAPVKVGLAQSFIKSGLFEAALCQTRAAPMKFVLEHGGKGVEERFLAKGDRTFDEFGRFSLVLPLWSQRRFTKSRVFKAIDNKFSARRIFEVWPKLVLRPHLQRLVASDAVESRSSLMTLHHFPKVIKVTI